eukprot:jgi/Bigna1/77500/fgenesh1_pg.48_\
MTPCFRKGSGARRRSSKMRPSLLSLRLKRKRREQEQVILKMTTSEVNNEDKKRNNTLPGCDQDNDAKNSGYDSNMASNGSSDNSLIRRGRRGSRWLGRLHRMQNAMASGGNNRSGIPFRASPVKTVAPWLAAKEGGRGARLLLLTSPVRKTQQQAPVSSSPCSASLLPQSPVPSPPPPPPPPVSASLNATDTAAEKTVEVCMGAHKVAGAGGATQTERGCKNDSMKKMVEVGGGVEGERREKQAQRTKLGTCANTSSPQPTLKKKNPKSFNAADNRLQSKPSPPPTTSFSVLSDSPVKALPETADRTSGRHEKELGGGVRGEAAAQKNSTTTVTISRAERNERTSSQKEGKSPNRKTTNAEGIIKRRSPGRPPLPPGVLRRFSLASTDGMGPPASSSSSPPPRPSAASGAAATVFVRPRFPSIFAGRVMTRRRGMRWRRRVLLLDGSERTRKLVSPSPANALSTGVTSKNTESAATQRTRAAPATTNPAAVSLSDISMTPVQSLKIQRMQRGRSPSQTQRRMALTRYVKEATQRKSKETKAGTQRKPAGPVLVAMKNTASGPGARMPEVSQEQQPQTEDNKDKTRRIAPPQQRHTAAAAHLPTTATSPPRPAPPTDQKNSEIGRMKKKRRVVVLCAATATDTAGKAKERTQPRASISSHVVSGASPCPGHPSPLSGNGSNDNGLSPELPTQDSPLSFYSLVTRATVSSCGDDGESNRRTRGATAVSTANPAHITKKARSSSSNTALVSSASRKRRHDFKKAGSLRARAVLETAQKRAKLGFSRP